MASTNWSYVGLALALVGPGAIALASKRLTNGTLSPSADLLWLVVFITLVFTVAAIGILGEKLKCAEIGLGRISIYSMPSAIALAAFFIFVFGPAANWALRKTGVGSFDHGTSWLAALPVWYLCLTVIVVAAGEEWLYRGYAIERLQVVTGDAWLAGTISLLAFTIAHLPVWGLGASLTTLVSGGIMTILYIWSRDISFLIVAHVITDLYGLVITPIVGRLPH
ncbi:MAG: CPBP family intramembrane metalloprotease [Zavarzinia sp.]|nr:CPBP family intramembrane metalloprotease [Zavarzinia sp.]